MVSASDAGKAIVEAPKKVPGVAGQALRRVLDLAIDGYAGLDGARECAGKHMDRKHDRERAIDALVVQHVGLASAQGFLTNLGGIAAMAVGIPANISAITLVQSRMVAGIAHLRGHDVFDPRVRTAILMCLLGEDTASALIRKQALPTTPMAIATAPVHDANLDAQISERVVGALLTHAGTKRVTVLVGKRIPLIGGGVGAVTDGWSTTSIAHYAREQFVVRRTA